MPSCPIGFRKYSHLYKYIFYCFICGSLYDIIFYFGLFFEETKLSNIFFDPILNQHSLFKSFYKYLGYIIFSFYYYHRKKRNKNNENNSENNSYNIIKESGSMKSNKSTMLKYELIYYEEHLVHKYDGLKLLIICLCFAFFLELKYLLVFLDLREFELGLFYILFTSIFMLHYYKTRLYIHQLFSLILSSIINLIIFIIVNYTSFNKDIDDIETEENIAEIIRGRNLYCILIYFLYFLISLAISFSRVKAKTVMELKNISPYKIIFFTGCFGLIINLICLIFSSIFKCNEDYCEGVINFEKGDIVYNFDSFPIYFSNLKYRFNENKIYFFIEIIIIYPLSSFLIFNKYLCEILMIYFLNPIYILVSDNFYFTLQYILLIIYNFKKASFNWTKLILLTSENFSAAILYLVYLEIIELRFCGFEKNLKRKIYERSKTEVSTEYK